VLVRSIYRTIKLAEGWKWKAIKTQVYFNLFCGMRIVLVMVTLNSSNPTKAKTGHLVLRKSVLAHNQYNK
jgi:hypothetical protein